MSGGCCRPGVRIVYDISIQVQSAGVTDDGLADLSDFPLASQLNCHFVRKWIDVSLFVSDDEGSLIDDYGLGTESDVRSVLADDQGALNCQDTQNGRVVVKQNCLSSWYRNINI